MTAIIDVLKRLRRMIRRRSIALVAAAMLALTGSGFAVGSSLAAVIAHSGPAAPAPTTGPAAIPVANRVSGVEQNDATLTRHAQPSTDAAASPAPSDDPRLATRMITLVPGDTLWALAIRYHTSVAALQSLNGLGGSTLIMAGAPLRVPGSATTRAAVPAKPADVRTSTAAARHIAAKHPAPPAPAGTRATVVAFARAQLGRPYIWGGTGPDGFDCSGLVLKAYAAGGIHLPRGAADQADAGTRIRRDQLTPGDLVFSNGFGHVQLYIGDGRVIEAARPGTTIRISVLPPPGQTNAYVLIAPLSTPTAAATTHSGAPAGSGLTHRTHLPRASCPPWSGQAWPKAAAAVRNGIWCPSPPAPANIPPVHRCNPAPIHAAAQIADTRPDRIECPMLPPDPASPSAAHGTPTPAMLPHAVARPPHAHCTHKPGTHACPTPQGNQA